MIPNTYLSFQQLLYIHGMIGIGFGLVMVIVFRLLKRPRRIFLLRTKKQWVLCYLFSLLFSLASSIFTHTFYHELGMSPVEGVAMVLGLALMDAIGWLFVDVQYVEPHEYAPHIAATVVPLILTPPTTTARLGLSHASEAIHNAGTDLRNTAAETFEAAEARVHQASAAAREQAAKAGARVGGFMQGFVGKRREIKRLKEEAAKDAVEKRKADQQRNIQSFHDLTRGH